MQPSKLSFEKNGIVKLNVNVGGQLLVFNNNKFEENRSLIATISVKVKITAIEDESGQKSLNIALKGIDIQNLKLLKGKEELVVETMVLQTLLIT